MTAAGRPNLARFQFLDPASRDFYPDWDLFAEMCVGIMRAEAGRDPHDRGLQDLVGELSTRSEVFRRLWADHNVRTHGAGTKRFHHPVVGELTLAYEELAITAEPGLVLLVYTAEPGSPSAERLRLLASWAAPAQTPDLHQLAPNDRENPMQITRSSIDTAKGPGDWFTGDVYIDAVAAAPPPSRVTANLVHFMPGARTHWHRHPLSQTVFVTEGVGLCQRRGGPVEVIRPGDRVLFEADEEHWHGAARQPPHGPPRHQRRRRPARRRPLAPARHRRGVRRSAAARPPKPGGRGSSANPTPVTRPSTRTTGRRDESALGMCPCPSAARARRCRSRSPASAADSPIGSASPD